LVSLADFYWQHTGHSLGCLGLAQELAHHDVIIYPHEAMSADRMREPPMTGDHPDESKETGPDKNDPASEPEDPERQAPKWQPLEDPVRPVPVDHAQLVRGGCDPGSTQPSSALL
jgi:hypothetical protein